jgi:hypothetical protein
MDYPLFNEYFTLAVNLGVLVGIVFLIVEIKNTELHKSDSRKSIVPNALVSVLVA